MYRWVAVAVMLIATATPASAAGAKITIPELTGPYPVGTTDLHLVSDRPDPWKPDRRREIMVTVTYPSTGPRQRVPWMTPGVAQTVDAITSGPDYLDIPRGSVDWGGVRRRARTGAPISGSHWPVVLFSPGFGAPREIGAGLADDLASHGYVVVSMSHTFESGVVEFPGGRLEFGIAGENDGKKAIDARVSDTRFVLDQLASRYDLTQVGMFGHSFGGFTAGETMVHDQRVDAGVNLDGGMPGEVVTRGLDRPFLLMGAHGHTHVDRRLDPTWADFWPHQRGWKRDLNLDSAQHHSFTDFQFALPQLSSLVNAERRALFIGTIDPARSLAAQHDYLAAYFDLHLKGRDRHLFDGDSPCHPDARFIA